MKKERLLELAGVPLNEGKMIKIQVTINSDIISAGAKSMDYEYDEALELIVTGIQAIGDDEQYIEDLLNNI